MIIEILLSILVFCTIWFFIFKIKLLFDNKKILKDIANKIEKQNKRFFIDGKEVNLIKELKLQRVPKAPPGKELKLQTPKVPKAPKKQEKPKKKKGRIKKSGSHKKKK